MNLRSMPSWCSSQYGLLSAGLLSFLSACTSLPTGPSNMALPGTGKHFDEFRADDASCREYAFAQVGGASSNQASSNAGLKSAAAGTAVGAAAGAAMGGHEGAGVGAGMGLLVGSMAGSDAARQSAYGTQNQYDMAYTQCMYGKGHRVAVPATFIDNQSAYPANPPPSYYPPPPPR